MLLTPKAVYVAAPRLTPVLLITAAWLPGATLAAAQEDPVAASAEHTRSLHEAKQAWNQAITAGDIPRIFSFWTDDVVIYPAGAPAVRGIEGVRAFVRHNREVLGLRPRVTVEEMRASASGDMGWARGTYEWVDAEGRAHDPGRYVELWRKEDGEWKCFLEIHSASAGA